MRRCLAVCVVCVFLLFGAVPPAWADTSFSYLDENGDLQQRAITAGHVIGGDWDANSYTLTGWYAVTGTVSVNHVLAVQGEAFLILTDGAVFGVTSSDGHAGINVSAGNGLTVYAQSTGAGMGSLTATSNYSSAGIGGNAGESCGAVTINGGVVTASGGDGPGIGGGVGSSMMGMNGGNGGNGGSITINGGVVTASSTYSPGIGGGIGSMGYENYTGGSGGAGGTFVVNGGSVTASSHYGAGIGGGDGGPGIPIGNGGNGGDGGDGATVTVNGGSVTASTTYGAGIGGGSGGYYGLGQTVGGSGGNGGTVTINGGVVTASSTFLASIGGGDREYSGGADSSVSGDGGTIIVNGGTVTGSQIGMGGSFGPSGTVEINGGTVNGRLCTGWYSAGGAVTIRGGTVVSPGIAKGLYGYAGGTVNISGGTVTVGSDGMANGDTGGSVTISGGSVNVSGTMGSTPTNGSANGNQEVYLTRPRLDNVNAVTAVSALTAQNASYYGTNDLYTDADGYLYLYLPSGAAATRAQTVDRTYVGSVAAGQSGALALPATDSALSGLALSEGTLDPAFDSATTGYAVSVSYDVADVTVTPTVSDTGKATVTVNGVAAESGSATGEIPLAVGDNAIEVVCTAEDTVTQTTYTITITRSGAPVINVQPMDKTVTEGRKTTFTVTASGTEPLSYQWYVDREGVKGWVKIDSASARTATYTTSATKLRDSGYRYACLVENAAGSIRSDAATLTVIEKSSPQTGDDSNLPLWIVLALLSGFGLAALLTAGRRGFNRR